MDHVAVTRWAVGRLVPRDETGWRRVVVFTATLTKQLIKSEDLVGTIVPPDLFGFSCTYGRRRTFLGTLVRVTLPLEDTD